MDLKRKLTFYSTVIIIIRHMNYVKSEEPTWGYEVQTNVIEPSDWNLISGNCNGYRQSPINIRQDDIDYTKSPSMITSIRGLYSIPKSIMAHNDGHTVNLIFSYLKESDVPTITASTGIYKLAHVHVHFGTEINKGSEHSFDHHYMAAEVHAVFENSIPTSRNSSETFLVMTLMSHICGDTPESNAVPWTDLYKTSKCIIVDFNRNNEMSQWWPFEEHIKKQIPSSIQFKLADFVIRYPYYDYFTYLGSLTSPPCTENARFVIPNVCSCINRRAMRVMRRTTTKHGNMAGNYRPVNRKGLVKGFPHIEFMSFRCFVFN